MLNQFKEDAHNDLKKLYDDFLDENIQLCGPLDQCDSTYRSIKVEMYQLFTTYVQFFFAKKGYYVKEYEDGWITTELNANDFARINATPFEIENSEYPWSFNFINEKNNSKIRIVFLIDFIKMKQDAEDLIEEIEELHPKKREDITVDDIFLVGRDEKIQRKIALRLCDEYFGFDTNTYFVMHPEFFTLFEQLDLFLGIKKELEEKTGRDAILTLTELFDLIVPNPLEKDEISKDWRRIREIRFNKMIKWITKIEGNNQIEIAIKGKKVLSTTRSSEIFETNEPKSQQAESPHTQLDEYSILHSLMRSAEMELRTTVEKKCFQKYGKEWISRIKENPNIEKRIDKAEFRLHEQKIKREKPSDRLVDYLFLSDLLFIILDKYNWEFLFNSIFDIHDRYHWLTLSNLYIDARNDDAHANLHLEESELELARGSIRQWIKYARRYNINQ
jgi:hypothetical protein